jgi:8-oxo-dGTP pyrophosphatase MutT (NUDIX family)
MSSIARADSVSSKFRSASSLVPPNGVTLAGTVIVARDDGEFRVMMLRRQAALKFLGGFWVFPGGVLDPGETADAARVGLGAVAAAACRELDEEAALSVHPADLVHFAHWITPSAMPRRFDTHFFVVTAPPDQEPCAAVAEASEVRWVARAEWELGAQSGHFPLMAPTLIVLKELWEVRARHGSLAALLEHERDRQVRPVLPKILGDLVVLPWDPEYQGLPGDGLALDETGVAERAGCPARLAAATGRPR